MNFEIGEMCFPISEVESLISGSLSKQNSQEGSFEDASVDDLVSLAKTRTSSLSDGVIGKTLLVDNPRIR